MGHLHDSYVEFDIAINRESQETNNPIENPLLLISRFLSSFASGTSVHVQSTVDECEVRKAAAAIALYWSMRAFAQCAEMAITRTWNTYPTSTQPLHPIFFAIKIASHSFPVPRSESESRLFERDILKRSGLLISSTIRHDRRDFTDNRLLRACRGQRFAFVRQITFRRTRRSGNLAANRRLLITHLMIANQN